MEKQTNHTAPQNDQGPTLIPNTSGICPWCKQSHLGKCSYSRAVPTITIPISFTFKKKYDKK